MTVQGPTIALLRDFAHRAHQLHPDLPLDRVAEGLDLPDLLSTPETTVISAADEAAFVQRTCDMSGDPDLGFDAGLNQMQPYNLPGYIARHSPTIREGIKTALNYTSTVRPGLSFIFDEGRNIASLSMQVKDPALLSFPRYFELIFAAITAQIRSFTGRAVYPEGLSFTHTRVPVSARVRARLGCSVEFAATKNEMLIDHGVLDAPLLSHDDILRGFLVAQGDRALAEQSVRPLSAAETVELLVEGSFPETLPSLGDIAKEMGLSARSLSRRLQDAETSFKEILGHVRLRIAMRELSQSDQPISEIAYRLGYAGQSAFATAFRRETGLSPSDYRKREVSTAGTG